MGRGPGGEVEQSISRKVSGEEPYLHKIFGQFVRFPLSAIRGQSLFSHAQLTNDRYHISGC